MPYAIWDDNCSVQIDAMDTQHRCLFEAYVQLGEAMKQKEADTVLESIMDTLTTYAREHLSSEEALLEQHHYPDLVAHKELHNWFLTQLLKMNDLVRKHEFNAAIQTLQFLSTWFYEHIKGTDQQYAQYFAEQGIDCNALAPI